MNRKFIISFCLIFLFFFFSPCFKFACAEDYDTQQFIPEIEELSSLNFLFAQYQQDVQNANKNYYREKENELIFTSRLGEAEKLIAKVAFDKISFIAPAGSEIAKNTKEIYRYNAKNSFSGKDAYVLIFSDEKKRISKLTFNASEKLLEELSACGIKVM